MSTNSLPSRHIIANNIDRRPYGAKVNILLGNTDQFRIDGESCLILGNDLIVRLIPKKYKQFGFQEITAYIEGFATASAAEETGLKFAMSVLWTAVSLKCPLRLEYHTPLPCLVYDRTSKNEGLESFLHVMSIYEISGITKLLEQTFTSDILIDKTLLISMEIFAAARLEATERTRFVGLVSALEPLAQQKKLENPDLEQIVQEALNKVKESSDIPENIKPSIQGRIRDLKRESVSQAIYRLIRTHLPGDERALNIIKEAYDIRSKILHEGSTDADLREKSEKIENIIRRIYSEIVGYELCHPA
jgi:hypothetical protein